MNKFISTAIFYANSKLHLGNSYEAVYTDAIARYYRMCEYNTFFMTGMDEHGQKIEDSAKQAMCTPKQHVDAIYEHTKTFFDHLLISSDYFIRTTDENHKENVKSIFKRLVESNDIYLDKYEGDYCVRCESFFTKTQLEDGMCPDCSGNTIIISEESYFLNLKKYEKRLIEHINNNPNFILPLARRNEILSFLEGGLENLSVTRTSLEWGIPTIDDPKHVIYVWIDALSNYLSSLGYPESENFDKFWNNGNVTHVIGKDILRFHAVYWPIMLMALDVKLPDTILTHGFLMMGEEKMSKSKGNVVYAQDYTKKYGVDPLRYYLLFELANGNDGLFTTRQFLERYNYDLVNDLSNLVNRTASMCTKYFDGNIRYNEQLACQYEKSIQQFLVSTVKEFTEAMENYNTKKALSVLWTFISKTNKFIDETSPWVLAKEDEKKLMNVLYTLIEALRNIAILLSPFMPETAIMISEQINVEKSYYLRSVKFDKTSDFNVAKPKIIFARVDVEEEILKMENNVKEETNKKPLITIDDFDKLDLRVATVLECIAHPNADKLLLFKLKVGDETRQICSGIAKYYKPEELVGKNVVIVANLKPVKLRGELSEGMILSAELGDDLNILETIAKSGATVY